MQSVFHKPQVYWSSVKMFHFLLILHPIQIILQSQITSCQGKIYFSSRVNWIYTGRSVTFSLVTKAQFNRQTSHEPNLVQWVFAHYSTFQFLRVSGLKCISTNQRTLSCHHSLFYRCTLFKFFSSDVLDWKNLTFFFFSL